jgi:hypothetical protein
MTAPRLNLDVSDLKLNDESVSLIILSLALECHNFAVSRGIPSHSVESQLHLVGDVFTRYSDHLLDVVSVLTPDAPSLAAINVRFSNEGYGRIAGAAKDRIVRTFEGDANV